MWNSSFMADFDNFSQYIIPLEKNRTEIRLNRRKKEIGKKISYLCKWCNEEINIDKEGESVFERIDSNNLALKIKQEEFLSALADMIGNIILINTEDVYILKLSWIPWEDLGDKKCQVLKDVRKYVESNSQTFSEERRNQCLKRIEYIGM